MSGRNWSFPKIYSSGVRADLLSAFVYLQIASHLICITPLERRFYCAYFIDETLEMLKSRGKCAS